MTASEATRSAPADDRSRSATLTEPRPAPQFADPRDALFVAKVQHGGLGRRTAKGMAWTIGGQWIGFVVQIAGTVFLARLLTPRDYGLYGSVMTVTAFADQFKTLGLSQAVVQRATLTHKQVSGLFWVNVSVGAGLCLLIAALAPFVAMFFGDSELVGLTVVLSLVYLLSGLAVQHNAILMRNLRFKSVALRTFISSLAGAVAGVIAASLGAGYWALAIGTLTQAVVGVITVWMAVRWVPSRPQRHTDIGELLRFGGNLSIFNILNYFSRYADNILIGRFLGAAQLGLYTRAYGLLLLPLQQINNPAGAVVQASMSRVLNEPPRYRKLYMSAMRGLSYLTVPLVAFFAVMAEEVIRVMLGDQWTEAADVFRLLAIGGMFQVIGYNNGWLYVSSGNTARMARWALFSRPMVVVGFVVGLPWGITGVAAGFAVTQVLLAPIGFWSATRDNPVSMRDIGTAVWRSYVLAGIMAALVLPLELALHDRSPFLSLAVCLLAAVAILAAGIMAWPGARRELFELLAMAGKGPAAKRQAPRKGDSAGSRAVPVTTAGPEEGSS